jgi:hypothetical protein
MTAWLAGLGIYMTLLVCVLALVGATRAKQARIMRSHTRVDEHHEAEPEPTKLVTKLLIPPEGQARQEQASRN